jgi:two-component SAPR family response regulator
MRICFVCEKEITTEQKKYLLGLDIPYVSLLFHRDCYTSIEDINVYLQKHKEKVFEYKDNLVEERDVRRTRTKRK